jgi:hypothetical protein
MIRNRTLLALVLLAGAIGLASAKPREPAVSTCDRDCLKTLAGNYLASWVAHDASKVPLAPDVKIVENAKRIKPGEGLWKTTTAGPTDFKIIVPDDYAQQVGGLVMIKSQDKPAEVGFRLKVENGKITEAEHMIALPREQVLSNLEKVRPGIPIEVPYEYRDSRGRLIHIAKSYYDALDNNNGYLAPFAPDCERRENGIRTAPSGGPSLGGGGMPGAPPRPPSLLGLQDCTSQINSGTFQYITVIGNRRVLVADELSGLALGFSQFHHAMQQKEWPIYNDPGREVTKMDFAPFDLPAMHIFKIWGGQIHEIEAIGFAAPYNSPSGWEEVAPAPAGAGK